MAQASSVYHHPSPPGGKKQGCYPSLGFPMPSWRPRSSSAGNQSYKYSRLSSLQPVGNLPTPQPASPPTCCFSPDLGWPWGQNDQTVPLEAWSQVLVSEPEVLTHLPLLVPGTTPGAPEPLGWNQGYLPR